MKIIKLNPNQIITLNDYPLYNQKMLHKYLKKCKLGEKLPFIPVLTKVIVRKHFSDEILKKFNKFEKQNQTAKYFMLDGSHRTTALTLAGCKINAIIYEKDKDIINAKKLIVKGKIIENGTLNHNLEENCEILHKHFKEKPYFMTVEQKTKKMIKEKIITTDC
ncbi:hypothetical protein COV18_04470 [Candidatus Woesearchaeota archaeon CG10_big_fil_rev_8_21_14_0_10_37_12]|nr:MAG: hypothetical protein COV18_04470 [Candidatus Woesearchaeota archaeon CG10_big_fil_rev_8_21_14_0_10_37_12]